MIFDTTETRQKTQIINTTTIKTPPAQSKDILNHKHCKNKMKLPDTDLKDPKVNGLERARQGSCRIVWSEPR